MYICSKDPTEEEAFLESVLGPGGLSESSQSDSSDDSESSDTESELERKPVNSEWIAKVRSA